jgi:hypothetical protein
MQKGRSAEDWQSQDFQQYAAKQGHQQARTRNKGRKRKVWWAQRCAHHHGAAASSSLYEEPNDDVDWPDDADDWPADDPVDVVESSEEDNDMQDTDPLHQAPVTPPMQAPPGMPEVPPRVVPPPVPPVAQQDC